MLGAYLRTYSQASAFDFPGTAANSALAVMPNLSKAVPRLCCSAEVQSTRKGVRRVRSAARAVSAS